MSGLAGSLRERVSVLRPSEGRDAFGSAGGEDWTLIEVVWASVRPTGRGALVTGAAASAMAIWQITLRPCDVRVGDRIDRVFGAIDVREVRYDPALPDRIVAIGEERR